MLTELQRAALADQARYQAVMHEDIYDFISSPVSPHPSPGFLHARASWLGSTHPGLQYQSTCMVQPREVLRRAAGPRPRPEMTELADAIGQQELARVGLVYAHLAYVAQHQPAGQDSNQAAEK